MDGISHIAFTLAISYAIVKYAFLLPGKHFEPQAQPDSMSYHEEEEQVQADVKALPLYETQQGEMPHLASMSTQPTAMRQCADHAHHNGHQKQCYQQHASFVGYNWNFFIFHFSFHKANLFTSVITLLSYLFASSFSMRHLFSTLQR